MPADSPPPPSSALLNSCSIRSRTGGRRPDRSAARHNGNVTVRDASACARRASASSGESDRQPAPGEDRRGHRRRAAESRAKSKTLRVIVDRSKAPKWGGEVRRSPNDSRDRLSPSPAHESRHRPTWPGSAAMSTARIADDSVADKASRRALTTTPSIEWQFDASTIRRIRAGRGRQDCPAVGQSSRETANVSVDSS